MPSTYTLIAANTLSTATASVTFSAIPATFTDLVVRASVRINNGVNVRDVSITFNGIAGTSYSETNIIGDGSIASSGRRSNSPFTLLGSGNADTTTANTFSSLELYIPSYTVAQNKPYSSILAQEDNATAANVRAVAALFRNTAAITSFTLEADSFNFFAGSSFYLYGVKNS